MLEVAKIEFAKEIKDRDAKFDLLNEDLKNHVNIVYIKNILLNFLTSSKFDV